jgi:hypothetical protein
VTVVAGTKDVWVVVVGVRIGAQELHGIIAVHYSGVQAYVSKPSVNLSVLG